MKFVTLGIPHPDAILAHSYGIALQFRTILNASAVSRQMCSSLTSLLSLRDTLPLYCCWDGYLHLAAFWRCGKKMQRLVNNWALRVHPKFAMLLAPDFYLIDSNGKSMPCYHPRTSCSVAIWQPVLSA